MIEQGGFENNYQTPYLKYTALYWATLDGQSKIVEALLKLGVNSNCQDNKRWTPLHLAAESGNTDILLALLAAKANPNSSNK